MSGGGVAFHGTLSNSTIAAGACVGRDSVCPQAHSGRHCWHPANWTHTVPNHRDDQCCNCGASNCVTLAPAKAPAGHGPFYPGA